MTRSKGKWGLMRWKWGVDNGIGVKCEASDLFTTDRVIHTRGSRRFAHQLKDKARSIFADAFICGCYLFMIYFTTLISTIVIKEENT